MYNTFKHNLDQINETEKSGKDKIDTAIKEKEEIIRKAKEEAKKEVEDYATKTMNTLITEKKAIDGTKVSMEELENKLKKETIEIKNQFNLNKEKVMIYLMENIFTVDLSVPDVVRGKFSEKLKNN